jgi:ABC-type nitrate/sulfonate/bicarbonate transport system permease component
MGTPHHLVLWRVLLPGALLSIFTGIRIALGFCFVLTISAEMISAVNRQLSLMTGFFGGKGRPVYTPA